MVARRMTVAAATLSVICLMGTGANAQNITTVSHEAHSIPAAISTARGQSWRARWRQRWIYRWRMRTERSFRHNLHNVGGHSPQSVFLAHGKSQNTAVTAGAIKSPTIAAMNTSNPIALTRQDTNAANDKPISSPMRTVGQGVSMLVYLLPVLFVIVGALQIIKRLQQKLTGGSAANLSLQTLPKPSATSRQSGSTVAAIARSMVSKKQPVNANSCNIRLVESTPLGNSCLALVEVRGKLLLLGVSGSSVALITEFQEQGHENDSDFRALMRAAAMDLDGVDFAAAELPSSAIMGDLGEAVAAAGTAVTRSMQRLRTVAEVEGAL